MPIVAKRERRQQDAWDKFWKDGDGNITVWQRPNVLLIGWLIITIASLFTSDHVANTLWFVALAILAVWAILEIIKGINYFRRLFGVVILVMVILAALKAGM